MSVSGVGETLESLFAILVERARELPEDSYTARLLSGPEDKLLKKITEEAGEVILAAKDGDVRQLTHEIADIVYHLLVVMVRKGMTLEDLADELEQRRKT